MEPRVRRVLGRGLGLGPQPTAGRGREVRIMRKFGIVLLAGVLFVGMGTSGFGHERRTDPVLAELNDYLAGVQILKEEDGRAEELFKLWQRVRAASWEIRRLTDEEDMRIDAPAVRVEIAKTRALRSELLESSRRYLSEQEDVLDTVRFEIGEGISVVWRDRVIETAVGSRKVVLIKVENQGGTAADVEMYGDGSDEILFWKKSMEVAAKSSRYTFAYAAPVKEATVKSTIALRKGGKVGKVVIRMRGTARPPEPSSASGGGEDACSVKGSGKSIRLRIHDAETKEPMAVRVEVQDASGKSYWAPLVGASYAVTKERAGWETPLWQYQTGPYFYIDGAAELGVEPAGKTVRAYHGFEYEPVVIRVPEDGVVEAGLRRWVNMAAKGWHSGHTHIHTTDAGMPVEFTRFWPLVAEAEDISVSNILTLKGEWETDAIYANEYPMGVVSWASQRGQIIAYGEEYRNNPYGHVCLLGVDKLTGPISSGGLGELGGPDFPPNAFILDAALAQNAVTIGAHFGLSIFDNDKIKSKWPSTGFEMPVDVALKKIQIAEVYGIGGRQEVWYKLLNCGFDIPATAGPDWDIKDAPRTYVYLGDEPLTFGGWTEGLKEGRSFITKGPMIFLTVEGEKPGAKLNYPERPKEVLICASAVLPRGPAAIEVIVNGEVVAKGKDINKPIRLEESCWIAARCRGAHTSPIYVTLEGRRRGSAKEAIEFLGVIDRLIEWVNTKGLFDSPKEREAVLDIIQQGRSVYESIMKQETK